jgi:alpha-L-fucosidase
LSQPGCAASSSPPSTTTDSACGPAASPPTPSPPPPGAAAAGTWSPRRPRQADRAGLKFGVYLSPWDRTESSYGSGRRYDDFYVGQLTELLTGYGEIFEVWLDGACGEGPDGRTQVYDWDRYYDTVRTLQPGAVIAVCGPDVRWCGNEAGHARAEEWSVVPASLRDAERVAARSQQADDADFSRQVRSDEEDLGSRAALAGMRGDLSWYPAEVNTSIRPGWFHHRREDHRVRDADTLFALHRAATGGNASFLLNVPPDRHGLIGVPDKLALAGLGERLADQRRRTTRGLRTVSSGSFPAGPASDPASGAPGDPGDAEHTVWRPDSDDRRPTITISLDARGGRAAAQATRTAPAAVEAVLLREHIADGQRIEHVVVTGIRGGERIALGECGAVGNRRILPVTPTPVDAVEIAVTAFRATPVIAEAAVILADGR